MKKFQPGNTVIHEDGDFTHLKTDKELPPEYQNISVPEKDKEYTVRKVVQTERREALLLVEIVNPLIYHDIGGWKEPAFSAHKFRLKE